MTELKLQFTEAMVTVMKSWGWRFLGLNHARDPQWSKYEKGNLVASFGDETWERDFVDARLATLRKGEVMLSKPVIDLLKGMGWTWAIANSDAGEWFKFNSFGKCEGRQGDQRWIDDVEAATVFNAEDEPEVWEPTMELRLQSQWRDVGSSRLQQKWVHISGGPACDGGSSEWRNVEYVNAQGMPFAWPGVATPATSRMLGARGATV